MTDAPLDWFDTYLRDEPGHADVHHPVSVHVQGEGRHGATSTTGRRRLRHPRRGISTPTVGWPPTPPTTTDGARPLPLRPRRPDAVDRRHRHAHRRRGRQPRRSRRVATCSCTRATCSPNRSSSSGPVSAELHVSSTLDHTDFFVRVCDVHPDGTSLNVCDGLQRYRPSTDRPRCRWRVPACRSRCGRRVTASPPAIACASRCRAARTPSTPATSGRASRTPLRRRSGRPTNACTTNLVAHRRSRCRISANSGTGRAAFNRSHGSSRSAHFLRIESRTVSTRPRPPMVRHGESFVLCALQCDRRDRQRTRDSRRRAGRRRSHRRRK